MLSTTQNEYKFTWLISPTHAVYIICINCMHTLHAYITCIHCMHTLHAYIACIHCMHILHAYIACIHCMHTLHAYIACIYCMHILHVYIVCIHCMHILHAYIILHYTHFPFLTGMSGNLNLVYAFDTSDNVKEADLKRMKSFVKAALQLHDISKDTVNVGIASYGKDASLSLDPKDLPNKETVLSSINNLIRIGGENRIDKLLTFAEQNIFKASSSTPTSPKKLLIIFAKGGLNVDHKEMLSKGTSLRKSGVQIALVLIGGEQNDIYSILTGNQITYITGSQYIPAIYPQIEQYIGGALGKNSKQTNFVILYFSRFGTTISFTLFAIYSLRNKFENSKENI